LRRRRWAARGRNLKDRNEMWLRPVDGRKNPAVPIRDSGVCEKAMVARRKATANAWRRAAPARRAAGDGGGAAAAVWARPQSSRWAP
jgi:hypothetical protein